MDDLRDALREALELLKSATGMSSEDLFGDWAFERSPGLTPAAARAVGTIEGAALALGLTPLELLDDLGLA